ncbi:MAG: hypothetical protein HQM14_16195 [SAR324 cluster bacterium]|nr:hypothetical protein [SAR324 cluster bacterium]
MKKITVSIIALFAGVAGFLYVLILFGKSILMHFFDVVKICLKRQQYIKAETEIIAKKQLKRNP